MIYARFLSENVIVWVVRRRLWNNISQEQRKNATLKTQVEAYKRSTLELETKLGAEIKRADKSEYEVKRLTEKLEAEKTEKERLLRDREQLREMAAENSFHENKIQGKFPS